MKRRQWTSNKYSKRSRKYKSASSIIPRSLSTSGTGFPRQMKMTHTYRGSMTLACVGATSNYYFSCNGMYDPDITGTGGQPLYFDTMTAIYDHYCVIGSKIKITCVPVGTTAVETIRIILNVDDDASGATTSMDAIQQQKGAVNGITGGLNPNKCILLNKWSAKQYFGGSVLANTELQGTSAANPTEQSYFRISYRAADGVSTPSFYLFYEINYVAVWKELKDVIAS